MTPQHLAALELANEVRTARAHLRRSIHDTGNYDTSRLRLAELFRDGPPECMATMRLDAALDWVYRMGPVRIASCLRAAECSPYKRIGDLTPRQQERLIMALETDLDYRSKRSAA